MDLSILATLKNDPAVEDLVFMFVFVEVHSENAIVGGVEQVALDDWLTQILTMLPIDATLHGLIDVEDHELVGALDYDVLVVQRKDHLLERLHVFFFLEFE